MQKFTYLLILLSLSSSIVTAQENSQLEKLGKAVFQAFKQDDFSKIEQYTPEQTMVDFYNFETVKLKKRQKVLGGEYNYSMTIRYYLRKNFEDARAKANKMGIDLSKIQFQNITNRMLNKENKDYQFVTVLFKTNDETHEFQFTAIQIPDGEDYYILEDLGFYK